MTTPTADHLARGHRAESKACAFLQERGLTLLERNYRTPYGELDLIMDHPEGIVFVEVRFRRSARYGLAAETIDRRKQQRLRASAEYYLQRAAGAKPCRFDVVTISGDVENGELTWIQNAI